MAHILDLHRQGLTPKGMVDYPVEHIASGKNTLILFSAFEPFGPYKIYALGKVNNREGKLFLTISIESNDTDQPAFAKEHPKEAAAGARRFSLDAYAETGLNAAGQRTQTHYTFKFIDGQPTYDTIRSEFIDVASGKAHPSAAPASSSRSGARLFTKFSWVIGPATLLLPCKPLASLRACWYGSDLTIHRQATRLVESGLDGDGVGCICLWDCYRRLDVHTQGDF